MHTASTVPMNRPCPLSGQNPSTMANALHATLLSRQRRRPYELCRDPAPSSASGIGWSPFSADGMRVDRLVVYFGCCKATMWCWLHQFTAEVSALSYRLDRKGRLRCFRSCLAASQPVSAPGTHSRTPDCPGAVHVRSRQPRYPKKDQVPDPVSASLNQWPGVCESNTVECCQFRQARYRPACRTRGPEWRCGVPYGPVRDTLKYRSAASRKSSVDGAAIQACTICRAGMDAELCCISFRSCSATKSP